MKTTKFYIQKVKNSFQSFFQIRCPPPPPIFMLQFFKSMQRNVSNTFSDKIKRTVYLIGSNSNCKFSPVSCLTFLWKPLPQLPQSKILPCLWRAECRNRLSRRAKDSPHCSHLCKTTLHHNSASHLCKITMHHNSTSTSAK